VKNKQMVIFFSIIGITVAIIIASVAMRAIDVKVITVEVPIPRVVNKEIEVTKVVEVTRIVKTIKEIPLVRIEPTQTKTPPTKTSTPSPTPTVESTPTTEPTSTSIPDSTPKQDSNDDPNSKEIVQNETEKEEPKSLADLLYYTAISAVAGLFIGKFFGQFFVEWLLGEKGVWTKLFGPLWAGIFAGDEVFEVMHQFGLLPGTLAFGIVLAIAVGFDQLAEFLARRFFNRS
jgi:hypothetical protein